MRKRLFVCCTNFQIFNAVLINYSKKEKGDIYDLVICNHFSKSFDIYSKCEETNIWDHCYYLQSEYKRNYIETLSIIHKLDYNKMITTNKTFVWDYDEVFIGTFNNISTIIAYRYCKNNQKKLTIIDEGIGSYIIGDFHKFFPKKQLWFRKLVGHVIMPKFVNQLLLYSPKYYCGNIKFSIGELPKIYREDKKFVKLITSIFNYDKPSVLNTVIIFDQPLVSDNFKYLNFMKKIVKIIENTSAANDFMIKWHPRTNISFQNDLVNNIASVTNGGWEVYLLNSSIKNSKIYITPFSSAAILGRFMFDDHDVIIFLYKLLGIRMNDIDVFVKKLSNYGVEIYTPTTFLEFQTLLEQSYTRIKRLDAK